MESQIDFSALYIVNKDYILRSIAGETVAVPIGSASHDLNGLVNLNETGVFIWKSLLEKPGSVLTVSRELAEEYDTTPENVQDDVAAFMSRALDRKFLLPAED